MTANSAQGDGEARGPQYNESQRAIFQGLMDKAIAGEIDNQIAWDAARDKGYRGSSKTFYVATYKRKVRLAAEAKSVEQPTHKKRGRKPKVAAPAQPVATAELSAPGMGFEQTLKAYIDSQVKIAVKQAVEESLRDLFARIASK